MSPLCAIAATFTLLWQAGPPSLDPQRLEPYSAGWSDAAARARLEAQAMAEFGGRGPEIATRFLAHTSPPPRNDAFYFLFRAVGDVDAALLLIRALPDPPPRESGILDRHFTEIAAAIEAVLANEAARRDPRVVAALEAAAATARSRPSGAGRHEAVEAVRLIGLCRSNEAAQALARFAADPDASIRAAAATGLGQLDTPTFVPAVEPVSPAQTLLRLLTSDPDPAARRQAADALGAIAGDRLDADLRAALAAERDPRVVDGIVLALGRRGAPVQDPRECRDLIGRAWESVVARQLLDCWLRGGATRDELIQAAVNGAATQRAVALAALAEADPFATARTLVQRRAVEPPPFEPSVRERLLEAAAWVLSQGRAISPSARDSVEQALWGLSGREMPSAIAHADRVTPHAARVRASAALSRADAGAYDAMRRPRQAAIALAIALGFALLALWRSPLRRPAVLLALSAAGWALWTLQASGVRALPPPPLQVLTVAALAWLAAGLATGAATLVPRRRGSVSASVARGVLTLLAAALLAGVAGFATRSAALFPSDLAGWELIVDPLGAAILAAAAAAVLGAVDRLLSWRALRFGPHGSMMA